MTPPIPMPRQAVAALIAGDPLAGTAMEATATVGGIVEAATEAAAGINGASKLPGQRHAQQQRPHAQHHLRPDVEEQQHKARLPQREGIEHEGRKGGERAHKAHQQDDAHMVGDEQTHGRQ